MNLLTSTVARILFSIPFLVFGINHFMMADKMKFLVPSYVPGGIFWVYLTGAALVLAGISIIAKWQGKLACLLLSILLLTFILTIHIPGMGNPETMQMALIGLLKDIGLVGGALLLAGIFENEKRVQETQH